jgi:hypothetical protein
MGIYLSGGLDSPLGAEAAKRLGSERHRRFELTALTWVYDHLIPDDERHFAGLVARALGIPIRFVPADDFEVFADPPAGNWRPPEPVGDPFWADQLSVASSAASVAPVFLTGWDGDAPLRADVRLHWRDRVRRRQWRHLFSDLALYVGQQHALPPIGLRTLLKRSREALTPAPQLPAWIDPGFAGRRDLSDRLRVHAWSPRRQTAREGAYANYALPQWGRLFDSNDPNWTGAALEARHPLLDTRLVAFLLGLPAVPWCVGKEVFRRVAVAPIPAVVRCRPKTPLRGDPLTARLSRMSDWAGDGRRFEADSEAFVVRAHVPPLARCGSVDAAWLHLRPFGLDYWLKTRRRSE